MRMNFLEKRMRDFEKPYLSKINVEKPTIARIDGKAFHTWSKKLKKPFDERLATLMQETSKYLLEKISGFILSYTQSDEITLILYNKSKKILKYFLTEKYIN